ncbi:MAG: MFS transporter [Homoserinimonas sp.]
MATARALSPEPGLFSRDYLWITLGSCALVFLGAFESLAVTTVMPVVSADLDGAGLYALAFAGPLATGVIGMVVAGNWCDRVGPITPLYTSAMLFVVGLLIAGTAALMPVLVAGRLVQGLGAGAINVALYVVVARVYPARLHPQIFAGFAAAWVIPSLIGPFAAGVVTELFSWHWVFLGVVGLVVIAAGMVWPAIRGLSGRDSDDAAPWSFGPIGWSVLAAGAVLGLGLLAEVDGLGGVLVGAGIIIVLVAVRPLLPTGTLRSLRGLPSVILLRGLAGAAFLGAEVYLPYLLVDRYEFAPSLAGLALTLGALAWAGASWLQGRLPVRLTHRMSTVIGASLVLASILLAGLTALLTLSPAVAIIGWGLGGGGMGLMYPRLSVMTLAFSSKANQGFNSSALSISDSLGAALALAITGIVFTSIAATGLSFAAVFGVTAVAAVGALIVAPRVAVGLRGE